MRTYPQHERRTSTRLAQDVVGYRQEYPHFLAERILGKAEVDSSILSGGTITLAHRRLISLKNRGSAADSPENGECA